MVLCDKCDYPSSWFICVLSRDPAIEAQESTSSLLVAQVSRLPHVFEDKDATMMQYIRISLYVKVMLEQTIDSLDRLKRSHKERHRKLPGMPNHGSDDNPVIKRHTRCTVGR